MGNSCARELRQVIDAKTITLSDNEHALSCDQAMEQPCGPLQSRCATVREVEMSKISKVLGGVP